MLSNSKVMKKDLSFKFNPNLDFQLDAINSVVRIVEGFPRINTQTSPFETGIVPNLPPGRDLHDGWLFENVLGVQELFGINQDQIELDIDDGLMLENISNDSWKYPSFTIEMETGTGKTYVYLRTIHELYKEYGFRKYIVVVPSIAIFEGVIKNFQITKSHFAALYGNPTINLTQYDSDHLSDLRKFANSTFIEIMVITLQSFNRNTGRYPNRIYRPTEQLPGERLPYEFIQETRPILILDEPQNMATKKSKSALRTLKPLFALRYSATHRETPNLLYQLTPFEAYRRGLVKKIEVLGVSEHENFNNSLLVLEEIERKSGRIYAKVRTNVNEGGITKEKTITLYQGDNLYEKTLREEHRNGYVVSNIVKGRKESEKMLEFEGVPDITALDVYGDIREPIFRMQIRETIYRHMEKQIRLLDEGIKVLSLFFIDRVDNYVKEDGIIKNLFDEAFERLKKGYPHFENYQAEDVRAAYFARRDEEAMDTDGSNKAEREAEKQAFQLIMKDKEQLLDLEEPVSFIFSHSALREGWDNPNVFQICTLNQTVSKMKKRQEIGRGLRIPVNQEGERIFDDHINVLTVIANESYENYVGQLQTEYEDEGYAQSPPKPSRAERKPASLRGNHYYNSSFREFWEKLMRRTSYEIHVDTDQVVKTCALQMSRRGIIARLKPKIVVETGDFVITQFSIKVEEVFEDRAHISLDVKTTHDQGEPDYALKSFEVGDKLSIKFDDQRLRGFKIEEIIHEGAASKITFSNDQEIFVGNSYIFESESGQIVRDRRQQTEERTYPVFNLLDRAAKETGLTRPTINRIFKETNNEVKEYIFKNPEGFANVFIFTIKDTLANHIAENLEFAISGEDYDHDLRDLFPDEKKFVQEELIDGGPLCLYDQVQIDSAVEKRFVEKYLSGRDEKVICYFKFPPKYKIDLPNVLGNYNPDWGILRYNKEGDKILELVRETKGSEDIQSLQYSHEKRKIVAAKKHFREIGVDYRTVSDETSDWWGPDIGTKSFT